MDNVPFYGNPDNDHCLQAALRMILKYFLPNQEYSWSEMDAMSAKMDDLWTWPQQAWLTLQDMGFDVVEINMFDYTLFISQGAVYLHDFYGSRMGKQLEKHSDISQGMEIAKRYIEAGIVQRRAKPSLADIRDYLDQGYLAVCHVDSTSLNGKQGNPTGHFVVVYDVDEDTVTLHDPGRPPCPGRTVGTERFTAAWNYLIALRRGTA